MRVTNQIVLRCSQGRTCRQQPSGIIGSVDLINCKDVALNMIILLYRYYVKDDFSFSSRFEHLELEKKSPGNIFYVSYL